jgi:hypothetical protein
MIPRIRGRVGLIEEHTDPKFNGKWIAEMFLGMLGDGDPAAEGKAPDFTFGPFDTQKEAEDLLSMACRDACDVAELAITGEKSGKYLDMKDNRLKAWETPEGDIN